jgi:MarR family transcriptional regulator, organic hydroperoxide resistance regulator
MVERSARAAAASTAVTASGAPRRNDRAEIAGKLRDALRELRIELAMNKRQVAAASGLRDSDLDVLDVLDRFGPHSPTPLARRMGIHPATMTGVLTRLENTGWLARHRDVVDRRSVQIESTGFERLTELYRDANSRLDGIADGLAPPDAAVIVDYLAQIVGAMRTATALIAGDGSDSRA